MQVWKLAIWFPDFSFQLNQKFLNLKSKLHLFDPKANQTEKSQF